MNKTHHFLACLLTIGILFSACKEKPFTDPKDLDSPVITLNWPPELPEGQYLQKNNLDTMQFNIEFSDDFELSDYVMTVRYRTEMDYLDYLKTSDFPWTETWYGNISGISHSLNFPITIAWDPSVGPYEIKIVLTDESGKKDSVKTYLYVSNGDDRVPPTLSMTVTGATFPIGSWIPVRMTASDAHGIEDVFVRVRNDYTNETLPGSANIWQDGVSNPVTIDTSIYVPAGTVPGSYWVESYAHDSIRNVTTKKFPITIITN